MGGWNHAQGFQQDQVGAAAHRAYVQALNQAKETARIAPCPRCGRRPVGGVVRYVLTYVVLVAVLVSFGAGLASGVFLFDWSFVVGLFGLAVLAFAILLSVLCVQGYRDARTKAIFTDLA